MNNEDKLAILQKNAQESFKHSSRLAGIITPPGTNITLDDFYIAKTTHQPLETFGHIPLEERIKVIAKAWVFYGGDYNSFWKSRDEILTNIYHVLYKEE